MERAKKHIANAGHKLTKPRVDILRFLHTARKPHSVQEIFKKIKGVDLVSVYRTLSLFTELRIVYEDTFGKEKRYCLATYPHHHILCRKCGRVEEVACTHDFSSDCKGFRDVEHQLSLTGVCRTCA